MSNSEFGFIEKKDGIFMMIISIGSALLFSINSLHTVLLVSIISIMIYQAFKDPFICWGTYIITQRYLNELATTNLSVGILGILIVSFFLQKKDMIRKMRYSPILLIGIPTIVLSIYVGVQSVATTGLLMGIVLLTVVVLLNYSEIVTKKDTSQIAFAYCCSAISIGFYFLISTISKSIILLYGRLNFLGDIKPVAFSCFIPLLFLLSSRIQGKRCFDNIGNKFIDIILVFFFSTIIILTAARGMIIAGIIALLIQILFSHKKAKIIWRLIPLILFVIVFFLIYMDSSSFRLARTFDLHNDEIDTLNGRTGIWGEYIELYLNGNILNKIFGFGPGHGGRLINSRMYTHSTYLDYLISYGAIGFLMMIVYEISAISKILRTKDFFLISVMFFAIIGEATHGVSANFQFLSLQVFLILCASSKRITNQHHT